MRILQALLAGLSILTFGPLSTFAASPSTAPMRLVEIPQIEGSISVPESWHTPTAEQAMESVAQFKYPSAAAKSMAELGAMSIGRQSVAFSLHPEPFSGVNPMLVIGWTPIPPPPAGAPAPSADTLRQLTVKMLSDLFLPTLEKNMENFKLLEPPKALPGSRPGAWVTFQSSATLKTGETVQAVHRFFIFPAMSSQRLISANFQIPANSSPETAEIASTINAMLASLKYEE